MRIRGSIHMIELDSKIIGICNHKRILFFYFQNSQMSIFKRYLYQGNWIDLEYEEDSKIKKGMFEAFTISYVYRIEALGRFDRIVYYDKTSINNSLSTFLNNLNNIMFLDLEMTMPSYSFKGKAFKTEVIQAGLLVVNKNGDELVRYTNYVKPTIAHSLSRRAEDFLGITSREFFLKAIDYKAFYKDFSDIIKKYSPAIVVFGRNDIIVLNDSYSINGVPSLKNKTRFINLCQLIKNYYDLRNDPGLFKLFKLYYDNNDIQVHDAFNDCEVTHHVFKAFKEDIQNNKKGALIRRELD
ncbi:MAG: exonuclease domain-containing protein [Anaeroplasma sp.]